MARLFRNETDGFGLKALEASRHFTDSVLVPLDACLGVKGLPQSATGQTTLFTGINGSRHLGYHLTAFPNRELLPFFEERSIMKLLREKGVEVTAANLYSREFFTEREGADRNRFPASTLTIMASGVPFRMLEDYARGRAVFADITNRLIRSRGYDIQVIEPEIAGERTAGLTDKYDFIFFEYFLTDRYGHKRNRPELERCIDDLNRYVSSLAASLDLTRDGVLIVSDHGNAEEAGTASHTRNPVPGLLIGGTAETRERFALCRSIEDMHPFMLSFF